MKFEHIDHGFVFEELVATTTESGRTYRVPKWGDFEDYESVTTVLNYDKKEFFEEWARTPGNKKKSEAAAHRGNIIHDAIENYLNNVPDAFDVEDSEHRAMLGSMRPYLNKINNVHALEVPLYSHMMELAGRVDCVGEYEGVLSIIDFKGSTKTKKEEWILNYFLQATAYSVMWEELTGQQINQLVIIMGNEDGFCQIFKKDIREYVPLLFRHLMKYQQFKKQESK